MNICEYTLTNNFCEMCVIDEKQETVARIRMAIDNDRVARLNLESTGEDTSETESTLDLESDRNGSNTWQLGSPEGKKMNLRAMAVGLSNTDPQYRFLDERLRNFIACHMPKDAVQMRFEDEVYVSLNSSCINSGHGSDISHRCRGINVLFSSFSRWRIGPKALTLCDATQIFTIGGDLTVLLSTMTHQKSVLLDSMIYSAVSFLRGRHSTWRLFAVSLAANGNQGPYGTDAECYMRSRIPHWFRWTI